MRHFYYLTVLVVEWCVTCLQFHSDRKWWPPSKKGTLYSTEAQNKVWQQNRKCKTWLLYIFFFIPPHVLRESGFRNQRNFCLWNPESWALESGIQLKESGIPITIGSPNSKFRWQSVESMTWNPESKTVFFFKKRSFSAKIVTWCVYKGLFGYVQLRCFTY